MNLYKCIFYLLHNFFAGYPSVPAGTQPGVELWNKEQIRKCSLVNSKTTT